MKKYLVFSLITSLISCCLLLAACKSDNKSDAANAPLQLTEKGEADKPKEKPISSLPKELPQEFKDMDIPIFKGATIQDVAKHNHASSPKIQVRINTESSPKEVEEFYIKTLREKGWTVTNSTKIPKDTGAYFSVYTNGDKRFLVNSLPHPEKKITIATMILMDLKRK